MITDPIAFIISEVLPWLVSGLFLIILVIIISLLPRLLKFFISFPIWLKLTLAGIIIISFLIRFYWVPNIHRINFDEDRYLSYAVTFARYGLETNINISTPEKIIDGDPDSAARITVPTLNGWVLKIFGYSEKNLFTSAKLASIIEIILIFILAIILTKNHKIAIISAFGFAFLPPLVFWSTSTTLDPYFVGFTMLTVISAIWYSEGINPRSILLFLSSITILLFVRIEAFFVLPVVALFIILSRKNEKKSIISKRDIYLIVPLLVIIGFRIFISLSVVGKPWCCGDATPLETFMPGYLIRNTLPNLTSLFLKPEIPFILTILALMALLKSRMWYIKILGVWFFIFFFLYSTYYAGKLFAYDFSGSYGRFFLMLTPPFILLAATSINEAIEYYKEASKRNKRIIIAVTLLLATTLIPTLKNYRFMISTSPFERIVEADTRHFHHHTEEIMINKTEKDAVIVHTLTGLISLSGRTSVYVGSLVKDPKAQDFVINEAKKGKAVYMLKVDICEYGQEECRKKFNVIRLVDVFPESIKKYNIPVVKLVYQEP